MKTRNAPPSLIQPLESRLLFTVLPAAGNAPVIVLGDLNGDGKADLVTATPATDAAGKNVLHLSVQTGNGDGTFRRDPDHRASVDLTPEEFEAMCIGDVNNDGLPDLCLVHSATDAQSGKATGLALIDLNKDGSLSDLRTDTREDSLAGTIVPIDIAAGDMNGDGLVDVAELVAPRDAATGQASGKRSVRVIWNAGGNTGKVPLPPSSPLIDAPTECDCIFTGDVDGDGAADLVATRKGGDKSASHLPPAALLGNSRLITVRYAADGTGVAIGGENPLFEARRKKGPAGDLSKVETIALADLDGDGIAELVGRKNGSIIAADFDRNSLVWSPRSNIDSRGASPPDTAIAVGDLDGDGLDDFWARSAKTRKTVIQFIGLTTLNSDGTPSVTWTVDAQPPT